MKALTFLYAMLVAPAVLTCQAAAQDSPGTLSEYLPCDGTFLKGNAVRAVVDDSFVAEQRKVAEKIQSLSDEKKAAIAAKVDPNSALEYDADLWADRKAYDTYLSAWKKLRVVALNEVVLSVKSDEEGHMNVLTLTKMQENQHLPLTLSALYYDPASNSWVSNNGVLKPSVYVSGDLFAFGKQSGTEWKLEKDDLISKVTEVVRVTRSADNKFIYVLYAFAEIIPSSRSVVAQTAYILRFPVVTPSASVSKPGQK